MLSAQQIRQPNATTTVLFGLANRDDLHAVTEIYLQNFPERTSRWFRSQKRARRFYFDLMELMLMAYGSSFFVARQEQVVVGFLVLTLPGKSFQRTILWKGYLFKLLGRSVCGRYGLSPAIFKAGLQSLLATILGTRKTTVHDCPHVYAVAVDKNYRGLGIGSGLINRAKDRSKEQFDRLMLFVDTQNSRATRLYQRLHFRIVNSDLGQHEMVCDL